MFETAELGRTLEKDAYAAQEEELRTELLKLQRRLESADFPVVILVAGVDGAGRGDVVHQINEWMDTRSVQTEAFDEPTEEERQRPPYWRYWMALPPNGRIAVFTGAWYTRAIVGRAHDVTDDGALELALHRANTFERMLVQGGALIIKLWLHISEKEQKRRFKELAKDPNTAWRVTKSDKRNAKRYDVFRRVSAHAIRRTSTGEAPWTVIEAADERYRRIAVARHLVTTLARRLDATSHSDAPAAEAPIGDPETILDHVDLTQRLEKDTYKERLADAQARLGKLGRKAAQKSVGVSVVFEGVDAAGKGGAIRRIIHPLDARRYRVIRIAAPTDEERAHHYLWRFWRHLPRLGRFTIYDRSWYGRVLVERVEGYASRQAWARAFTEINDFEEQLVDFGIVLVKFWLHISPEEQLRRFEARQNTPWKQYKITDEDFRNRAKANNYERAANEMVERTSTEYAPWTLVAAEDKRFARVQVLETLCERLEAALDGS
jgi:AMP-polyphosphate phosphotransferase